MSYKVELVEKIDPITRLEANKSSIKDLFNDLLNGTKGFKYQITLKVKLNNTKVKLEFAPVYFNSTTKTVINQKSVLTNLFKKIFTGLITGLMKDLADLQIKNLKIH